ncbi:MAG: HAD family hydrolase, partial [Bacteroidota bacterium]
DGNPEHKVVEIPAVGSILISELDLDHKRPTVPRRVSDRCNVKLTYTDWLWEEKQGIHRRRRDPKTFRYKLVAFDLDGALIRGERFSWTLVWKYLADRRKLDPGLQALHMRWYRSQRFRHDSERVKAYEHWCDVVVSLFAEAGLKKADFQEIAKKAHVTKNLDNTFQVLRNAGVKLAIVSGGIDTLMRVMIPHIDDLVDRICINELQFGGRDERVSGIKATRYDFEGKLLALEEMCDEFEITLDEVVFVGDSFNDEAVVSTVGKAIAYSAAPDSDISTMCDVIITEDDLSLILPHILLSR